MKLTIEVACFSHIVSRTVVQQWDVFIEFVESHFLFVQLKNILHTY